MRQVDWNDLRLFLALVRGGTVRAAADIAGISHSTVARRMEQLEATAGVALYERVAGALTLTQAGEDLLDAAERMEEESLGLERRLFGRDRRLEGRLVLTSVDALAVDAFFAIFARFRAAHPGIDLRVDTSFSLRDLDRREADLALRFGQSPAEHLVGRRLMQTARAIYAAHDYAARFDPETSGWISFSPGPEGETWKRSTPFPDLPTHLRCSDLRSQQAACRAGAGIALLPCFQCDGDPGLRRVTEPECVPRQDMWLLRHADTRENARVRALRDHLLAELPALKPLLLGETGVTRPLGPA